MARDNPTHFQGKDAIGHVIEAQAKGVIGAAEVHGTEIPGHVGAFVDASRETALLFILFFPLAGFIPSHFSFFPYLACFLAGWVFWRGARASWLGWSRLERLHRVLEQEKWEIEHNRPQERDELRELYRVKGFEGKLLEDVLDVLMADGDRLLRVMVEEELGLSLQKMDHPLKQGLGAGLGAFLCSLAILIAYRFGAVWALSVAFIAVACSAVLLATYMRNALLAAVVWNVAIATLCLGISYYIAMVWLT